MLASKIVVFGKSIPVWLASLALVAATAGAATGVVLAGSVGGDIVTTVDQSLLVDSTTAKALLASGASGSSIGAQFNAVSDDGTKFTAGTEIKTGEGVVIEVAAINRSTDNIAVLIKLDLLPGITADIDGADGAVIGSDTCVRVGLTDFKCKLAAGASGATADYRIKLALNDEVPPGFYTTGVTMTQIENKS